MNLEEYKNKMAVLKKQYERKQGEIMLEYANSNSDIKIGDFFTDHHGIIKVESIHLYADQQKPSLVFIGAKYTKKLTLFASSAKRSAWQENAV